jgi:ferric-dicitrate binding protein FerR (iron transport regulator)
MTYDNFYITNLVFRHFFGGWTEEGKLTEDEQRTLLEWMTISKHNQALMDQFGNPGQLKKLFKEYLSLHTEKIWKKMEDRVAALEAMGQTDTPEMPRPDDTVSNGSSKRVYWPWRFMLAALAIVLIVLGGYFVHTPQKNIAPQVQKINSAQMTATARVIRTGPGEIHPMTLRDGTRVTLNAGSTLKIPASGNGPIREVTLEGEAYFIVVHSKKDVTAAPFTIHVDMYASDTGRIDIICLGTQFNVKAYIKDGRFETTLDEGSVQARKGRQTVTLKEHQRAVLDDHGLLKIEPAPSLSSTWENRIFSFKQEPADQILEELAQWYGVQINYAGQRPTEAPDQLQGFHTEPLDSLVHRLAKLSHFKYRIHSDTVYVLH